MPPKNVNTKVEKGMAKKAEVASKKQAVEDQKRENETASEWAVGSNAKKANKEQDAAAKADEAARKKREKQLLLEQEEAELGTGGKGSKIPTLTAKKKAASKNNSDLALLENALISAADKKAKKQKELEQKKKDDEAKRLKDIAERKQKELANLDPLLANTQQMLAGALLDDESMMMSGRASNVQSMNDNNATGIDAALQSLTSSSTTGTSAAGGGAPISHNRKALYMEFEQRMLPIVKENNPGLRLSQYKELIFNLWKKAPENPDNQLAAAAAAASR